MDFVHPAPVEDFNLWVKSTSSSTSLKKGCLDFWNLVGKIVFGYLSRQAAPPSE